MEENANGSTQSRNLSKLEKMRIALKHCRVEAGLTQEECRKALGKYGVSIQGPNSISNWERGPRDPSLAVLHAYSEEFDKDLRFLLGDIDEPLSRGSVIDLGNEEFEQMWRVAPPDIQKDAVEYFRYRLHSSTGKLILPKAVSDSSEVQAAMEKLIAALSQVE